MIIAENADSRKVLVKQAKTYFEKAGNLSKRQLVEKFNKFNLRVNVTWSARLCSITLMSSYLLGIA